MYQRALVAVRGVAWEAACDAEAEAAVEVKGEAAWKARGEAFGRRRRGEEESLDEGRFAG